ncbi:MAG: HNH endonuclease, partial [Clostridiales bacterium]|nr:HNH endonuclease [Clostridiales bacterium]
RRHNRQLHKMTILKGGIRKPSQAPREVKGFRLNDKVLYNGQECFVHGRRTSGYFDLRLIDGTKVHPCASWKNIRLLEHTNTTLTQEVRLSSHD